MIAALRIALMALVCHAAVLSVASWAQQTPPPPPTPAPAAAAPAPAVAPPAAPPLPREVTDPVEKLAKSIESAEKSIQQLKELEVDLQRVRSNVEAIIYDSTATAEQLRPQLDEVKSQIEKLGPPPTGNQPPESATIAAERARLNALAGALDGAVKTAELAWVRAKQLIDRITVIRYQAFAKNLFERRTSPLLPSMWREVGERMPSIVGRLQYYGGDWLSWAGRQSASVAGLLAGAAVLFAALWFAGRRFVVERRDAFQGIPTFFDRIAWAAKVAPARMLPALVATAAIYTGFDMLGLWFSPWERTAEFAAEGIVVYIAGAVIASVALSPKQPQWRLIPVDDRTAATIMLAVKALLTIYVLDSVLIEVGRAIYVPLVVTVAQSFLGNMATAGVLALLLLSRFIPQVGPLRPVNHVDRINLDRITRLTPAWIKLPLWLIVIAIVAASVAGYVALGRFIAQQIVLTGTVLAIVGLLYLAIRAMTRDRAGQRNRVGAMLESRFGLDAARQGQLVKLGEVAATLALLMLAIPVLLLQWGFAADVIRDWAKALFFGFEVGQFKISLVRILLGVLLFTALLFLTRMIQRWLRERVMTQARMDPGVANSVDTAVGYVGVGVAALLSVSYAGFDITSLAIVAGALSVGIGFGLQSIVNNFVSGLILLVERPIKVGDWIVVGAEQGNVRRISVRSTEIETFDRASLIVPNSELISGRVLNWTHRNLLGRVIIKLTTDQHADPTRVIAILEEAARSQPQILPNPAPNATLDTFSPTQLDFSLKVTLADINSGGRVKSNLHIAILEGFRDAGVYATIGESVVSEVLPQPQIEAKPAAVTAPKQPATVKA